MIQFWIHLFPYLNQHINCLNKLGYWHYNIGLLSIILASLLESYLIKGTKFKSKANDILPEHAYSTQLQEREILLIGVKKAKLLVKYYSYPFYLNLHP